MVFSSHVFVFYFLPLALLLYYAVPRRGRHLVLILLSYVFYGWANPLFVVLMLASTLTDYLSGPASHLLAQSAFLAWREEIHAIESEIDQLEIRIRALPGA